MDMYEEYDEIDLAAHKPAPTTPYEIVLCQPLHELT
jgi:hypothetical protein